ncbi:major capsid protein [Sigmofec virus UA08Rod_4510]|uniref:Major capsid protein n=1 Tax=Sigmofec virus UA08Rod_4510 TaxID=2929402 RepID=A0A976R8N0_9VIRU|nr:major capsid protein [Sigmofec virus UA08Rod_4510]
MSIVRNIGKNTLGDNDKMQVHLHDYHMSTQNLSMTFRSTLGVGMLVPFFKLLCQKGDVVDIQLLNKTMTHPTLGPLFGGYKLQHFMFFGAFRLYNSWLHNNRTGIGMKMSDIKLPMIGLTPQLIPNTQTYKIKTDPSSLFNYLGWKGGILKNTNQTAIYKQAIPQLIYWDIFKNYFANTQEDNFYMITKSQYINMIKVETSEGSFNYLNDRAQSQPINSNTDIKVPNAPNFNQETWQNFWNLVTLSYNLSSNPSTIIKKTVAALTSNAAQLKTNTVTIDKTPEDAVLRKINWENIDKAINLEKYPLETLDLIRDEILAKKGNETYLINRAGTQPKTSTFYKDVIESQENKLGGLLLKTYDSDIFQNWIKKEWIDGQNGIAEITAIDVSSGKLSLDTLNLQQKVYNMLNRIAVSDGTYRSWLETVYTAGKYLDRPETPMFIGGMSQIIEFEEVVARAASETTYGQQPLGDLAGRGVSRGPNNSGHIHYQCEEPGYIIGLVAITPLIDYSQGNDFDLNLETIDDLHKPALDGIGYQDSLNEQRAWWTANYTTNFPSSIQDTSAGKTVAWIDYMTNFNRVFGNFAAGESEDFMVLNRRYEGEEDAGATETIYDLTTYIDPTKHIEIFADTDLTSQNFWCQTAIKCTRRGNYSSKQIPNL